VFSADPPYAGQSRCSFFSRPLAGLAATLGSLEMSDPIAIARSAQMVSLLMDFLSS